MTADSLFVVCNNAVLPAWILLLVAPGWVWTQRIVHAIWIPLLLGGVYAGLLFAGPDAPEGAGFSTLAAVMRLFTLPTAALAGWVHYLVFDLFVGAWQVRDARRLGLSHLWVAPCLLLTLMLGPVGLLTYLGVRAVRAGVTTLAEDVSSTAC